MIIFILIRSNISRFCRRVLGEQLNVLQTCMTTMFLSYQRGRKHGVRLTGKACWPSQSLDREARVLPLVSTCPCATRAAPMSPCSVTAAPDTAGAWTGTDRRSLGPARSPAADQCVRKPHTGFYDWSVPSRHVSVSMCHATAYSFMTAG